MGDGFQCRPQTDAASLRQEQARFRKREKTMKQKIAAALCALVLLACAVPAVTAAKAEAEVSGTYSDGVFKFVFKADGSLCITKYKGDAIELTIPQTLTGTLQGYTVHSSEQKIRSGCVTGIGKLAFLECRNLTSVTLPESLAYIEDSAFDYCYGLVEINIPANVTSIAPDAFCGCNNLEAFQVSPENAAYMQIDGILYEKDGVTLYTYPGAKIGEVLRVPEGTRKIGAYAFYDGNMKKAVLPEGLTEIGESAFSSCTWMKQINLPDSLEKIGDSAFADCAYLTAAALPDSLTSIGGLAFSHCAALTSVTIPAGVTSIGEGVFFDAFRLQSIRVAKGNPVFEAVSGVLINRADGVLLAYPAGKKGKKYAVAAGITKVAAYAFSESRNLQSVVLPEGMESISDSLFLGSRKLRSVVIPEGVTRIGNFAFQECLALAEVTLPGSVTDIGDSAFRFCSGLTGITLPEGVIRIGDDAFQSCSGLTGIVIPESVTRIGNGAFSECRGLTQLTLPGSAAYIGYHAFESCTGLSDVVIPEGVTELGGLAFSGCTGLKTLSLPASLSTIGYDILDGTGEVTIMVRQGSYAEQYGLREGWTFED
jgi:hypothetical protein